MFKLWQNQLAVRLLLWILLFSAGLSLVATSVQLGLTFQRRDAALKEVTTQVKEGFSSSLSAALWAFDTRQVDQILSGIKARAAVASVKLIGEDGRVWELPSDDAAEQLYADSFEIYHAGPVRGQNLLGTLELGLTRAQIWSDLYAQVVVVFLSNIAKTMIASFAMLAVFAYLVSRHMREIAAHVSNPDWLGGGTQLVLDRSQRAHGDDLDAISDAINQTQARFGQVEADLRATSEQLRAVLDTTINGIIGLDETGMVDVINPAARHMLGGKSEATPFKWPEEIKFLDGADLAPLDASADPVNRALAGQVLLGETHLMTRADLGENRYVRVSSALVDIPGSAIKCVIVLDDVSLLEKNRQQVERKGRLDALGQLTGGIAHDFNNLLATVLYAIQLTRTDELSPRSERVLDTAMSAINRGRELTGRLLAFAKRQPGLSSSRLLSETFNEFKALARPAIEANLEIEFIEPEPGLMVHCDHGQLDNALLNLVLNSRDAIMRSGKGTRIIVKARALDELDADLKLRRENLHAYIADGMKEEHAADRDRPDTRAFRYVEISVTDDGPGMSAEVKRRAIDPFFTTKDTNSGTGLGLSMVYGFIQQSDGELRIYSEQGFGSTMRLILPRGTPENAREEPIERLPAEHGGGQRILVAEDEANLLSIMEDLLIDLGFTFVAARSGEEALTLIREGEVPDLLLTDIVMPGGIGGFELARKAREILPELPIVYMSGYTGFTKTEMGDIVAPLLQKPCPPVELGEVLREALAGSQPNKKND